MTELDRLLASVCATYGDLVASDAVAKAFAVAYRDASSYAAGRMDALASAFDEALKTELRRLLQTH